MSDSGRGHAFVRPDVRCFERVVHGSVSESELAEFDLRPADVCDFSVNTNPLGLAPNVLSAIATADWTGYPGDDEPRLRTALALRDRVEPEQVVTGRLYPSAQRRPAAHVAELTSTRLRRQTAAPALGAGLKRSGEVAQHRPAEGPHQAKLNGKHTARLSRRGGGAHLRRPATQVCHPAVAALRCNRAG